MIAAIVLLFLLGLVNFVLLLRIFAKLSHLTLAVRVGLDRQAEAFLFQRSQLAQIIQKENQLIMTVQDVKDRIAAAKTAIQATVTTEIAEVKALIQGQTGATPAQLDEIGAGVTDLESSAKTAIGAISDSIAGTPGPVPIP